MSGTAVQDHRLRRAEEGARWLVLAGVAAWVLHPFATNRQIGAGDALWYANMLADFCLQWRAGVFPVFAGQTDYAFNGAVYPLRVAPLYQHLAGVLDLLTAHRLGWFALQHLVVIVMGVAGIFSCYFSLAALVPERRWSAVAFAVLYLTCPGVLGTLYTQDLYMTWMTLPFLPVTMYGTVRAFQRDDLTAQVIWAAGLAALWFAHSPTALWMTLLTGFLHLVRLALLHRSRTSWRRMILGGALLALLVHYPFVSVAALHAPGAPSAVTSELAHSERITNVVHEVFPAVLLPVSPHARALSDLQLGYGLWLVWLGATASLAVVRSWVLRGLIAGCAFLFVLVLPMPGNEWLWTHLPDQIRRVTFYWPMHRFYLLLAVLLGVAGQLALAAMNARSLRAIRITTGVMLAVAGAWSLKEAREFVAAAQERTASAEFTALRLRPENRLLMNHSYGLFAALPPYFSNGVMDVRAEARLLDHATLQPLDPADHASPAAHPWRSQVDVNPGILKLEPSLQLEPGRRYELEFEFRPRTYTGILQLEGRGTFREYALPASGEERAFGSGPNHSHILPLWTTDPAGDEIAVRFIPDGGAGEQPKDYLDFGRFTLREVVPEMEAVTVTGVLPFQAEIRPRAPAWLEVPRMFQPGYVARIDQTRTTPHRSPAGLVMLEVKPGRHVVTLEFRGPVFLRLSYWLTLAAWTALPIAIAAAGWRQLKS